MSTERPGDGEAQARDEPVARADLFHIVFSHFLSQLRRLLSPHRRYSSPAPASEVGRIRRRLCVHAGLLARWGRLGFRRRRRLPPPATLVRHAPPCARPFSSQLARSLVTLPDGRLPCLARAKAKPVPSARRIARAQVAAAVVRGRSPPDRVVHVARREWSRSGQGASRVPAYVGAGATQLGATAAARARFALIAVAWIVPEQPAAAPTATSAPPRA